MEKERKLTNILLCILIIVIIIFGGLFVYKEFIDKDNSEKESTNQVDNTKKDLNENEQQNNQPIKEEVKEIDLSKKLNNNNTNSYTNLTTSPNKLSTAGLEIKVNNDKKSATLTIYWDNFGKLVQEMYSVGQVTDYQIKGFSSNIKEAYIGEIGQSIQTTKIIFLMEDGTIEYAPLFIKQSDKNNNTWYDMNIETNENSNSLKLSGKISGIQGIVKVYTADADNYRTVLVSQKDGSFYDLSLMIGE